MIYIEIDNIDNCVAVYVASCDDSDYDKIFPWTGDDEIGNAIAMAEAHANRISWKLGYEIKKNYGDIT